MALTVRDHIHPRGWPSLRTWLLPCVLVALLYPGERPAFAHHLVQGHKLDCSRYFPCLDALRPRVDFWIDVYSRWSTADAILHDAERPDRVYKIIKGKVCGRNGNTQFIKDQKRKIHGRLERLATLIERKQKINQAQDKHYLDMFPYRSPSTIRRAARNLRCQSGNKDGFRNALRRFGTYGPIVRRVLKDAGLHQDIQYLPFVESSYNPTAYSRVGAAGMWQIMPRTARVLGLELNAAVDERLDPEAASWAAVRYLKDSRKNLTVAARSKKANVSVSELTPFVITSYNYGVNGMRRAITRLGPDFLTVLNRYRTRKFRVAVKNFYAGFLAARHVARNAKQFFGPYSSGKPLRYDTVVLDKGLSIGRIRTVFGISETRLKTLNPALTRFVWHGWRKVPSGYRLRLPRRQGGWSGKVAYLRSLPTEAGQGPPKRYTVRRGDTACAIASAFRVGCRDLIDMNRLGLKAVIRIGQSLQIPVRPRGGRRRVGRADPGAYTVTQGDTVCGIAQRFGVKCSALLVANGLNTGSILTVGRNLVIPGALAVTASGDTYTVRKGDSACAVALTHQVACDALLAANELDRRGLIFPGQTLRVPRKGNTLSRVAGRQGLRKGSVKTTTVTYEVKAGDSACAIAANTGVACAVLLADNRLDSDSVIHPGQKLMISGMPVDVARVLSLGKKGSSLSHSTHLVAPGDSVCMIAQNNRVPCAELLAFNGLKIASVIVPGQVLRLPGKGLGRPLPPTKSGSSSLKASSDGASTEVGDELVLTSGADTPSSDIELTTFLAIDPLDRDIDLRVQVTSLDGQQVYRINVEPGETLGHYSDWLRLGSVGSIRKLNGRKKTQRLEVGDALLLPISEDSKVASFDQRRLEYHRLLVEEFKEHFEVSTVQDYTTRPGDSVWRLARSFDLPLWIIIRYNPELRTAMPIVGDTLRIPAIHKRDG